MLSRRYAIVLFNQKGEMKCSFHLRGWMPVLVLCALLAWGATDALLWYCARTVVRLEATLENSEMRRREQAAALFDKGFRLLAMEELATQLHDFNFKLGIMLGVEHYDYAQESADEDPFAEPRPEQIALDPAKPYPPQLLRLFHRTWRDLSAEEGRQLALMQAIGNEKLKLSSIPSIWPVRGRLSSYFGYRRDPFSGRRDFHAGLDIVAPSGTRIIAPAAGVVTASEWSGGYGRLLEITHSPSCVTRYAHLKSAAVAVGDQVLRGQIIAYVGNTGRSQAPHLHYEVRRNGTPVNPLWYIVD